MCKDVLMHLMPCLCTVTCTVQELTSAMFSTSKRSVAFTSSSVWPGDMLATKPKRWSRLWSQASAVR